MARVLQFHNLKDKMAITIDYSQLAISCATVFPDDMKKGKDTKKMQDIIRHVTLKSISTYNRNYKSTYGELLLCCDSAPTWRKKEFEFYKAHRKKDREESETDWDTVRSFIDELLVDLEEVFPYAVIKAPGAEGDDCIGAVVKHLQTAKPGESTNPLDELTGEPEKSLVVSADHDFKQLLKYKTVRQWSPMQKKWVTNDEPDFLIEKIIRGDKGDGIPSVLMPDDFFVNGVGRATSVTKDVIKKYKDLNSLTSEERVRYDRNKRLIDFECMPDSVYNSIIAAYEKPRKKRNRQAIFDYLVKKRCSELIDKIEDF
jgi:5'-3' exonuclease